jgi:HSP20 family molecular chaperone IbpA
MEVIMITTVNKRPRDPAKRMVRNFYTDWLRRIESHQKIAGAVCVCPVKITETKDAYMFFMYEPGLKPASVATHVTGNLLTITGEMDRRPAAKEGDLNNRFFKSFSLPGNIAKADVHTSYRHGIIRLVIKKEGGRGATKAISA